MKKIVFLIIFFIQCVAVKNEIWTKYSIRYIGTQKEVDKFVEDITKKGYEYRIVFHDSEGIFEVHYQRIEEK